MPETRLVTPQEAHIVLDGLPVQEWHPDYCYKLAHTVATEPERTRAAVVKALRWMGVPSELIEQYAGAIENDSDYA